MKYTLLVLALSASIHSYCQISRPVAVPQKQLPSTTLPQKQLPGTTLPMKPGVPITTIRNVPNHVTIARTAKGLVLKINPMGVYGNDNNLKALRLTKFNALSTEPSISKNINGVNILYKIKKNPDYDNGPTINPSSKTNSTEGDFNCTTTREHVTASSSSFLSVSADGAGIYPGAIYTFADFYNGNTLRSIGDGSRNPINIYTNNLANSTGDVAVNVINPSASTISSSIAPIVRNFSNTNGSATSIGQYTYSDNTAAMALNISAGGSYSGFSATAGFTINKQDKHIYVTCDYKIPLYTLSTEIPSTGFFTDPSIEATPNLMLVSSVMYGTRILANIDIDESNLSDSAFATFKYGDPSAAGAQAAFNYLKTDQTKKVTINTYVVGIAPQVALHPTSVAELLQQIEGVIHSVNYQTARPISYTLCDMAGNSLGVESATDSYTVKNCVPQSSEFRLVSAKVEIQTGEDGKEDGSNASITLLNNAGQVVAQQSGNTAFGPKKNISMMLNVTNPQGALLKNFQAGSNNLLTVFLDPKAILFGFDGWNIEHVSLTLEFKDQFGTPYPGSVKIDMNNATVKLEKNRQRLNCFFSNQLQSTTSVQP